MKKNAKGKLMMYMLWPVWLTAWWLLVDILLLFVNKKAAMCGFVATILYFAATVFMFFLRRKNLMRDFIDFSINYDEAESKLLKDMAIPYGILNSDGEILWCNEAFAALDRKDFIGRNFRELVPEVKAYSLPKHESEERTYRAKIGGSNYKIVLKAQETPEFDAQLHTIKRSTRIRFQRTVVAYLFDETELTNLRQENYDSRLIFGLLYIDNYEEVIDGLEDVKKSLLMALIDRKITNYMQDIDAVIRKLEKDKYFFIFQNRYLSKIQDNKFSLLYDVRSITINGPSEVGVTISIGLGVNAKSYETGYEYARAAIDLALGRGGDQAVIKDGEMISYFGGRSESIEKNTRVKARVKAHALRELVEAKDTVFIMGHTNPDVDSVGAAIGVYKIVTHCNKKAYIVLNEVGSSIRATVNPFLVSTEYDPSMFISAQRAKEIASEDDLLVIVDVNRPTMTECPELYDLIKQVIVLDHHRKAADSVDDVALSYIEPYASSACELVAEILQYIGDGIRLRSIEADAMYAGIMIDTNNFMTKTGVRTFEAAAYLRRNGADITKIRKEFRTEKHEYMLRTKAIAGMELFLDEFAFAECPADGDEATSVLAAKISNEMMQIDGIKAAFTFLEFPDMINISARSIDDINVQLIMEKLGGGGHMSAAAAQLTGVSVEEAKQRVKNILLDMIQNDAETGNR